MWPHFLCFLNGTSGTFAKYSNSIKTRYTKATKWEVCFWKWFYLLNCGSYFIALSYSIYLVLQMYITYCILNSITYFKWLNKTAMFALRKKEGIHKPIHVPKTLAKQPQTLPYLSFQGSKNEMYIFIPYAFLNTTNLTFHILVVHHFTDKDVFVA